MLGAVLGTAASIGSTIFGAVKARKAAKAANAELDRQEALNEAWYNRHYNEDVTQTASAQRVMEEIRRQMAERSAVARGAARVAGASEESVAQEKRAQNEALASMGASMAAQGTARKEAIEQQYMGRAAQLGNQRAQMKMGNAQAVMQAGLGAGQALGNLGEAVDDMTGDNDFLTRLLMRGKNNG